MVLISVGRLDKNKNNGTLIKAVHYAISHPFTSLFAEMEKKKMPCLIL